MSLPMILDFPLEIWYLEVLIQTSDIANSMEPLFQDVDSIEADVMAIVQNTVA